MREGRQVMMFGIFMGMIRGGSSDSTVVLADDEIVSPPIVPECWAVLAMHGDGLPKLASKVRPGGVLVRNRATVPRAPGWDGLRDIAVPATDLAAELGQPLGAGMVALGALAAATGLVAVASLGDDPRHRPAVASATTRRRQPRVHRARRPLGRGAGNDRRRRGMGLSSHRPPSLGDAIPSRERIGRRRRAARSASALLRPAFVN